MKVKLCDLEPNPFKKYINEGRLNKDRIAILKESIDHGTLPEHFYCRKNNGKWELTSGHHSIGALKEIKGFNYEVDVTEVDFSDEQMLIDMVRENITQRDTDFHDTREGIVLARNWLQSGETDVKRFNTCLKDGRKAGEQHQPQPDSYRSIATFLSKNGKAVSYGTVSNYLKIHDRLSPKLLTIVNKQDHATASSGKKDKETIGVRDAIKIATITEDWDEQEDLVGALQNSREQHGNLKQTNLTAYSNAPDEIKDKVRSGEIDLADVEDATIIYKCDKEKTDTKAFLTPTFKSQMEQFDYNVAKLEQQVSLLKEFFADKQFKEKYTTLKTKQKQEFNYSIGSIYERIKKCYDEVEFFVSLLPDENILTEAK